MVLPGAGKKEKRNLKDRVSVLQDDQSSRMDGGKGCLKIWRYFMPGNCTCENGYNDKFYVVCIIPKF